MKRLVVGITGASGVIYGVRLLDVLNQLNAYEIHLTISNSGMRALWEELELRVDLDNFKIESLLGRPSDQIVTTTNRISPLLLRAVHSGLMA